MAIVLDLFVIFLLITIVLLIIGFYKKQYILLMLSGIFFLILGTFIATGLQYKTGSTVTTLNSTVTQVDSVYTSWDDSIIKIPIVVLFLLFGLFILTLSWIKILGINLGFELWGNDEEE